MYGAKAKKHYPDGKSIRLNVADFCHRTELGPRQQLRGGELLGSCIRGYGVIWWRLDLWGVLFLSFGRKKTRTVAGFGQKKSSCSGVWHQIPEEL
jgi:hypothetical protein